MTTRWRTIYDEVRRQARARGFAISAAGTVTGYNAAVEPRYALPDFGRPDALAIVVGNDRGLWPMFLAAVAGSPRLRHERNPLDTWVVERLSPIFAAIDESHEVRFAHDPPPRRVAMQALFQVLGLTQTSPSHLSVHPVLGPWLGLRAVVVIDTAGPALQAPGPRPCDQCAARPCMTAMTRALNMPPPHTDAQIAARWRTWLAVRDACPVGRDARYGEQQLRYHYTKDPQLLTGN